MENMLSIRVGGHHPLSLPLGATMGSLGTTPPPGPAPVDRRDRDSAFCPDLPSSAIGPHAVTSSRRSAEAAAARPAKGSLIMRHFKETPTQKRGRYLFVALLFLGLMALAH